MVRYGYNGTDIGIRSPAAASRLDLLKESMFCRLLTLFLSAKLIKAEVFWLYLVACSMF
jgi:hypothetical protein